MEERGGRSGGGFRGSGERTCHQGRRVEKRVEEDEVRDILLTSFKKFYVFAITEGRGELRESRKEFPDFYFGSTATSGRRPPGREEGRRTGMKLEVGWTGSSR